METAILKFHITLFSDSISDKGSTVYPVLLVKRLNDYICEPAPKGSSFSLSLKHLLAAPASEAISPEVIPVQYKVWRAESKKSPRSREERTAAAAGWGRKVSLPGSSPRKARSSWGHGLAHTVTTTHPAWHKWVVIRLAGRLYFFPVSISYSTQGRALPATKGSRDWNDLCAHPQAQVSSARSQRTGTSGIFVVLLWTTTSRKWGSRSSTSCSAWYSALVLNLQFTDRAIWLWMAQLSSTPGPATVHLLP